MTSSGRIASGVVPREGESAMWSIKYASESMLDRSILMSDTDRVIVLGPAPVGVSVLSMLGRVVESLKCEVAVPGRSSKNGLVVGCRAKR
jgi:hypothetical protein